ncbi:uncharacterized protein CDV56_108395 [Aspergillus thermomutatus]|uniref:Uncharacterized protein n=1 Tax=Aspergillus thermomutatus TaxID=41047 RepID=A0A397HLB6_ASPTH|nr:uncharacterized protein CDV56_108395 [Aspergillus thermomutatus]RHZ62023.1 hypothetical protein CDV56_108395 [Aspergillus thermomutatus]
MPSKPIADPPLQPKKVHGVTRDDEPIDDYENAIHSKQQEEEGSDRGNIAASHLGSSTRHKGSRTRSHGSRNRSTTGRV